MRREGARGWRFWSSPAALAVAAALILGACAPQQTGSSSGGTDRTGSLVVGGVTRTYTLHLPPGYPSNAPLPLVINLHGGGGTGAGEAALSRMDPVADANDFLAAYPDGIDHHWNDGRGVPQATADDIGFLSTLIDTLVAQDHADRTRVYVTGISNGGMMTQRVGCELATKVAAIAPVAGLMPAPVDAACHPGRPMPVVEFQGTADPLMPFDGGSPHCDPGFSTCGTVLSTAATAGNWAARNGCASTYTTTQLPDTNTTDGPAPSHDSTVQQVTYQGCPAGGAVVIYVITGGGHTWPGGNQYLPPAIVGWVNRDIDASQVMWQFFAAQRLVGA